MKAILHTKFGPPTELQLTDIEKPVPKDNEVLIKIHATTVTTTDCNLRNLTFAPKWSRVPMRLFMLGILKPRIKILGVDLAGEVEAVGKDVKRFKIDDQVFGTPEPTFGTHAEYICIPADGILVIKPPNINWEEAASIALAGNTALYFMRDLGQVRAGQKVLINGASGAVGTFALQLAKFFGAKVTAVCGTRNLGLVKSLGADNAIDYTQDDFTKNRETYDVIFDAVGKTDFYNCKYSLKKNGTYLTTLPTLKIFFQMLWTSLVGDKKVKSGGAVPSVDNIIFLKELVEDKVIKPVIDKSFPLEQVPLAFEYVEKGHKNGNVVISVM